MYIKGWTWAYIFVYIKRWYFYTFITAIITKHNRYDRMLFCLNVRMTKLIHLCLCAWVFALRACVVFNNVSVTFVYHGVVCLELAQRSGLQCCQHWDTTPKDSCSHTQSHYQFRTELQAMGNLVPFPFLHLWYGAARLEPTTSRKTSQLRHRRSDS